MANTNRGRKFYICATPQPADLSQAQFEALTYIEVGNVGSVGETGMNTNIVSYDELATDVTQKQKGISNAGDPDVECARNPIDAGQIAMHAAAATKFYYATKFEDADAPDASHTNSVYFNRGLVTGPKRPNGRNEDFISKCSRAALCRRRLSSTRVNSRLPAIAGIAQVGQTLTAVAGRWSGEPALTYQWKKGAANIKGAIGATYVPVAGDLGAAITVVETVTNPAGTASATSGGTANVIAA